MGLLIITSLAVVVLHRPGTPQQKLFLPSVSVLNTFQIFHGILKQNAKFQPELKLQKSFPRLVLSSVTLLESTKDAINYISCRGEKNKAVSTLKNTRISISIAFNVASMFYF